MPTEVAKRRRPHIKSRSGCTQCRSRRVKCDETRPTCLRCLSNEKNACTYNRPTRSPGLHNFAIKHNAPSQPQELQISIQCKAKHPSSPLSLTQPIAPPHQEADLLRFFHVWSTQTCYSFTPTHAPFLRDSVGKHALSCNFLMGALLASSSLHLASEAKDAATARRLVHASLDHQNRAIVGLRQNLQSLSPENCDNVFLTAVLMMMCAFVSSIMPVAQAKSSTGMMVDAFHFLKGAQAVGIRCFPWLFKGRALELFGTGEKKATKKSGLDAAVAIERLQSLNNETSCGESRDLLNSLIVKLEKGFSGDVDEVPWLMSAGSDYIHLLCKEDLAAKALLMHYGVLLARTEGIWWARMAGEKIVEEMVQVLEGSWNGSADVIAWCREHARQ